MKITDAVRNTKVAELLLQTGALSAEGHTRAVAHCHKRGGRIEDFIIANRILNEGDLLRALSTLHGIRFISAEKLSKVQVHPTLLALVPRKLAEEHSIVPLLYDDKRILTVVTATPDDIMALNEVKIATGVADVVPLLARPEAVRCALMKAYHNDGSHFENMLRADLFAFVPTNVGGNSTGLDLDSGPMVPRPQAVIDLNEREAKRNASLSGASFAAVVPPPSGPPSGRTSSADLADYAPSSGPASISPYSVRPGASGGGMQPSPAVLAALQAVFDEGFNEGRASGRAAGNAEGRASALLRLLRRRGFVVDEGIELRVRGAIDTSVLDMWLDRAMEVATLQAVFAA